MQYSAYKYCSLNFNSDSDGSAQGEHRKCRSDRERRSDRDSETCTVMTAAVVGSGMLICIVESAVRVPGIAESSMCGYCRHPALFILPTSYVNFLAVKKNMSQYIDLLVKVQQHPEHRNELHLIFSIFLLKEL